mmetsp:Transcript_55373/g.131507  ORF Transcript_55373/g.131507 Transcript_55373/m.131507 type:complete len:251 (+) Transcript_55373:897-1649(+)
MSTRRSSHVSAWRRVWTLPSLRKPRIDERMERRSSSLTTLSAFTDFSAMSARSCASIFSAISRVRSLAEDTLRSSWTSSPVKGRTASFPRRVNSSSHMSATRSRSSPVSAAPLLEPSSNFGSISIERLLCSVAQRTTTGVSSANAMLSDAWRVRSIWARHESARCRISLEESLSIAKRPSRICGRKGCRSTCGIACSVETHPTRKWRTWEEVWFRWFRSTGMNASTVNVGSLATMSFSSLSRSWAPFLTP